MPVPEHVHLTRSRSTEGELLEAARTLLSIGKPATARKGKGRA
jgi:hypothetical protein